MTWARAHARELDPNALTRITAEEQLSGRGQFGRRWHSPPGNLYMTLCYTVPIGWPHLPHAAQVLALSAAKLIEGYGLKPKLKWPNDLQLGGKKVGGALCEVEALEDQMLLVNGIGLNVDLTQEACNRIDQPATSLSLMMGRTVTVDEVADKLTEVFQRDLETFLAEGFEPFKEEFEGRLLPASQRNSRDGK